MGKVRIIADSTCDLSEELLLENEIGIIPLNIILDMDSYQDGVQIKPEQIYEWSDKVGKTPKTASPELGYVIDYLTPFVKNKEDIIFFGISEEMSVTCQVIRTAASELEYQNIWIIDSMNLSTGIGLLVLRAATMVKEGKTAKEIVARIEDIRSKVRASFVVDTLTYLYRGGRCNAVTALIGNTLKLKPMIVVKDGKMSVTKKYRGRQNAVIHNYGRDLQEQLLAADESMVFITHSGIEPEIQQSVYKYIEQLHHFKHIYITRAGGVISSHCGPNTLGILFYEA